MIIDFPPANVGDVCLGPLTIAHTLLSIHTHPQWHSETAELQLTPDTCGLRDRSHHPFRLILTGNHAHIYINCFRAEGHRIGGEKLADGGRGLVGTSFFSNGSSSFAWGASDLPLPAKGEGLSQRVCVNPGVFMGVHPELNFFASFLFIFVCVSVCVIPALCQLLKAARPHRVSVLPSFTQHTPIGRFAYFQGEVEEMGIMATMQWNVNRKHKSSGYIVPWEHSVKFSEVCLRT